MDEQLLTADEVAARLRLKPQSVRDAAWRGKLPHVRLWQGKKKCLLRFRKRDIDELIRSRTVPVRDGQQ